MANAKMFLKSGHPATLLASFLYFDFSFAIWVLNGAMAPFITEQYHLTPAQIGLMVSVPTLAGALMRFPLGVLSQYIGRKNAAVVEMTAICIALMYGFLFVHSFSDVLAMGVLLGIAGASFGVALSLGAGWFPQGVQGARDGHRRRRQQRHGDRRLLRPASRPYARLAYGLWHRGPLHVASIVRDDLLRQGATRP